MLHTSPRALPEKPSAPQAICLLVTTDLANFVTFQRSNSLMALKKAVAILPLEAKIAPCYFAVWSQNSSNHGSNGYFVASAKIALSPVADPENFGGGGFEAQNLKNSDVFTKIESDFSAEIGNSNVVFAQIQVVSKKKKNVFTKIESDFSAEIGNSIVFFAQIQVVSKKKKKKKVFTKIETDFSPDSLRLDRWGG